MIRYMSIDTDIANSLKWAALTSHWIEGLVGTGRKTGLHLHAGRHTRDLLGHLWPNDGAKPREETSAV
jgi:hypothetical protein